MLPSRGLPPRQLASLASRHASVLRSGASRKFSSVPRKTAFSTPSSRATLLGCTARRAAATSTPHLVLSPSAVRHGSWYAPWSWGRSSVPADAAPTAPSELAPEPTSASASAPLAEPAVTAATPELQPAGLDQPAATATSSQDLDTKTIEQILSAEPTQSAGAASVVDPTAPISYWGNLKDLGLDYGWGPSAFFESLLEFTYVNTELGWAGTVVASALMLRTFMFFTFQRWSSDAMVTSVAMKPLLQPLQDEMEDAKRRGDEDRVQALKLKQQSILKETGLSVWKTMGGVVAQGVFGFGAFRALRGISSLPAPGMTTGGWAWFTDLTISDPYYVLPLAMGAIMYKTIQMGGESGLQNEQANTSMQNQLQIVLPAGMTAITAFQPSVLQLYFLLSSITGFITGYSLRQPAVRRFLGIRPLPTPEAQKLYSKVVKGEISYSTIKGADRKIRYQAPRTDSSTPSTSTTGRTTLVNGINVKQGAAGLPPHIKPTIAAEKSKSTLDSLKELKPTNISKKISGWIDPRDPEVKKKQEKQAQQKRALAKYLQEKKKKLEGE